MKRFLYYFVFFNVAVLVHLLLIFKGDPLMTQKEPETARITVREIQELQKDADQLREELNDVMEENQEEETSEPEPEETSEQEEQQEEPAAEETPPAEEETPETTPETEEPEEEELDPSFTETNIVQGEDPEEETEDLVDVVQDVEEEKPVEKPEPEEPVVEDTTEEVQDVEETTETATELVEDTSEEEPAEPEEPTETVSNEEPEEETEPEEPSETRLTTRREEREEPTSREELLAEGRKREARAQANLELLDDYEAFQNSGWAEKQRKVPHLRILPMKLEAIEAVRDYYQMSLIAYPKGQSSPDYHVRIRLNGTDFSAKVSRQNDWIPANFSLNRTLQFDHPKYRTLKKAVAQRIRVPASQLVMVDFLPKNADAYFAWKQFAVCRQAGYDAEKDVLVTYVRFRKTKRGTWTMIVEAIRLMDGKRLPVHDFESAKLAD